MKISTRETLLGWLAMVAVLFGVTYFAGQSRFAEWKDVGKVRAGLKERRIIAEHLLAQQETVNKDLDEFRNQIPQHPVGKNVTAELLAMLERTASDNGLTLLRRDAEKEKNVGDLYELSINCSWEAELDPLVRFLYALQVQGAILDIRQLTVTPGSGAPGRLKGNFTVDCAYTRPSSGLGTVEVHPEAPR